MPIPDFHCPRLRIYSGAEDGAAKTAKIVDISMRPCGITTGISPASRSMVMTKGRPDARREGSFWRGPAKNAWKAFSANRAGGGVRNMRALVEREPLRPEEFVFRDAAESAIALAALGGDTTIGPTDDQGPSAVVFTLPAASGASAEEVAETKKGRGVLFYGKRKRRPEFRREVIAGTKRRNLSETNLFLVDVRYFSAPTFPVERLHCAPGGRPSCDTRKWLCASTWP